MAITSFEYKQLLRVFYKKADDDMIDLFNEVRVLIDKIEKEAAYYALYFNHDLTVVKDYIRVLNEKLLEFSKYGLTVKYETVELKYNTIYNNDKHYFIRIYAIKQDKSAVDWSPLLIFHPKKKDKKKETQAHDIGTIGDML